jgi:hypothetical protein
MENAYSSVKAQPPKRSAIRSVEGDRAWRPMPIHNKGEVFNEWGAVIQQQDEIDQEMMRRE